MTEFLKIVTKIAILGPKKTHDSTYLQLSLIEPTIHDADSPIVKTVVKRTYGKW